jgi:hypothetical protein
MTRVSRFYFVRGGDFSLRNSFHTCCGAHSIYSDSFTRVKRRELDASQWTSSSQRLDLDLSIKAKDGIGL